MATRELSRERGVSMGKVLSDLARQALTRPASTETRSGIPLFPVARDGVIVTLELVNRLRDEAP